jgi:hypothetical protein
VVSTFVKTIHEKYKVNVLDYPTLPSVAFAIYRTHYIKDHKLGKISGRVYNDIKRGYYGGFVDVYQVKSALTHSYDANSLYPYSMKNYPLPVGNPTFFTGNPKMLWPSFFGFAYVEVICPKSISKPILPHKHRNSDGSISTIYPVGS